MSLFKVSKSNLEIATSSGQDTQCSLIDEENTLNPQPKSSCSDSKENNMGIISLNKNNSPTKLYSRKEINIFYSKIKLIRKKYNIKKSRKNHIDSLVKKAKSKFLKAIYDCLKYCIHSCNLCRLPQKFIINTRIEYNKKILNKTVEEIYTDFKLLPKYETLIQKNMVYKNKEKFLYSLMKTKLKDIYKYYIASELYIIDRQRIESKAGEGVVKLYDFVATNICEYFLLNKGNDKRLNRWHQKGNPNKFFIKKKRFEIEKKDGNSINNDNNKSNIKTDKNVYIKFNIMKLDNNPIKEN